MNPDYNINSNINSNANSRISILSNHPKSPDRNSRLFFLEFLIVLFFFLIISTVCIRLFVQAKLTTDRADALSHAQTAAASAAEILIAENGDLSTTAFFLNGTAVSEHEIQIFYDRDFQLCDASDASNIHYILRLALSPDKESEQNTHLRHALISVETYEHNLIYELALDLYVPLNREEVLS